MENKTLKLYHNSEISWWVKTVFDNVDYVRCGYMGEANYLLYPDPIISGSHAQNMEVLRKLNQGAIDYKIPYVAFLHDDHSDSISPFHENGIVFRTSMYKSQVSRNEYILPSFYKYSDTPFIPVELTEMPCIGFCGAITHPLREECLNYIRANPSIERNFTVRDRFHLGYTLDEQKAHENEFLDILKASPYQLCLRGAGNFSHRFYETLMYGRIPVIVDTDFSFPSSDLIDWNDIAVIASNASELPEKLIQFHKNNNIIHAQNLCRLAWEKFMSPTGFGAEVQKILTHRKGSL